MTKKSFSNINEIWNLLPENLRKFKKGKCVETGGRNTHPCKIQMNLFKNKIILDGDKLLHNSRNKKSCDCIIFTQNRILYIIFIELKSRTIKPKKIEQKFLDSIEKMEYECNFLRNSNVKPKFVLVAQKIQPTDNERLNRMRFSFYNKSTRLELIKCGEELK
jgi:hypothetical protein